MCPLMYGILLRQHHRNQFSADGMYQSWDPPGERHKEYPGNRTKSQLGIWHSQWQNPSPQNPSGQKTFGQATLAHAPLRTFGSAPLRFASTLNDI